MAEKTEFCKTKLSIVLQIVALVSAVSLVQAQDGPYLRGNLQDPHGSEVCNPCVRDVITAVNTLRDHGATMGFNWSDDYPEVAGSGTKNHWQGVQRMPWLGLAFPYVVVSSSHRTRIFRPNGQSTDVSSPAHFAVVEMASRRGNIGGRLRSNRLEFGMLTRFVPPDTRDRIVKANPITADFDHPGGMQAIGKYLLVGSDGNIEHNREVAHFSLWDMSVPLQPQAVWDEPAWELPVTNANSVGIVRLEDERYLMLRALADAKDLEFYILSEDLEQNPATYHDGQPYDRWNYKELQSELYNPDSTLDRNWADLGNILGEAGYQSTNLVTECETGQLYLICSHGRRPQGIGGDDFVDAFRVDVPATAPDPDAGGEGVIITKVAKRNMFPSGNSGSRQGDLQAAGGAYISPDNKLYYYATEHGRTGDGGYVKMIEFAPAEALDEVHFIEDAWVELYDSAGFMGRSIMLDYADHNLRDYSDFAGIEAFDNAASSVIYAIPNGYKLRLYSDKKQEGGFLDLDGNGEVGRIADFSQITLANGEPADNTFSSANWMVTITAARDEETGQTAPATFELFQNYPNPFNPATTIQYQLATEADVRIAIYDIKGQLIEVLVDERQSPGVYSLTWEGTDALGNRVASGAYLYRLEVDDFVKTRKLTLLR